jgi:hypothetical protein
MPVFNAHGLDATWAEPTEEEAQKFFDNLTERAVREGDLIRATTDEEVAYIATRAEEANLAVEAGSVGFTEWETSDAEVVVEESPAGEDKAAGLTMEMIPFDFLCRRIAPFRAGEDQLGSIGTQRIS